MPDPRINVQGGVDLDCLLIRGRERVRLGAAGEDLSGESKAAILCTLSWEEAALDVPRAQFQAEVHRIAP